MLTANSNHGKLGCSLRDMKKSGESCKKGIKVTRLWNFIDNKEFTDEGKLRVFFSLNCIIYCSIGFIVWSVISRFVPHMNTWDWALCFVLYPGFFIGYIGGSIFLCRKK